MNRLYGILFVLLAANPAPCRADIFDDALADPGRPEADLERDATSKPAQVLRFFGVPENGVVLDFFAGGGYYSELVATALGDGGTVYLHNNAAYLNFAGVELTERLRKNRLANVTRYDREINAIDLPENSVDLVLMILTYHDVYYETENWKLDPKILFTAIHRVLKPGGVLGIVDHAAIAGTGNSAAQELHRIDPAFAMQDIEGHGFNFSGKADFLLSADDPLDVEVFDASIRRKTSRFVYKFVEPES